MISLDAAQLVESCAAIDHISRCLSCSALSSFGHIQIRGQDTDISRTKKVLFTPVYPLKDRSVE